MRSARGGSASPARAGADAEQRRENVGSCDARVVHVLMCVCSPECGEVAERRPPRRRTSFEPRPRSCARPRRARRRHAQLERRRGRCGACAPRRAAIELVGAVASKYLAPLRLHAGRRWSTRRRGGLNSYVERSSQASISRRHVPLGEVGSFTLAASSRRARGRRFSGRAGSARRARCVLARRAMRLARYGERNASSTASRGISKSWLISKRTEAREDTLSRMRGLAPRSPSSPEHPARASDGLDVGLSSRELVLVFRPGENARRRRDAGHGRRRRRAPW